MNTAPSPSSSSRTLKIGMIGFGSFGQFLAKTMKKQDHTITATSRTDYSQLCAQLGMSFYREMEGFHEADDDVILLSTSILSLSQGCKMVEMTCEEHDKLAARSQFLTHTIGRILSEMKIKSTSIDTKNFRTLVRLKESTTNDSFDLFSGLFIHNKFAKQELKNLEVALEKVKQKLLETNEKVDVSDPSSKL